MKSLSLPSDEEILDEARVLVDSSDFGVQSVVDPLDDLPDPNKIII